MAAPPILAAPKGWKPPLGEKIERPKPAPRNIGPLRGGPGPLPRPQAPAFSPRLQNTFRPIGHGVGAPSKLASPQRQREVKENEPGPRARFLGIIPEPWREPSQAQARGLARVPRSAGVVLPAGIPGLQFLVGADAAARSVNAVAGNVSGKSLPGKLYNEALQIGM